MKNLFTILVAAFLITNTFMPPQAIAQSPEKMKYQAVARDNAGNVLSNQLISFRISILQASSTGTSVYSETHSVTSNDFGLANLNIGNGTIESGVFSSIDWGGNSYYVQVEMDPSGGTSYTDMGTSQLLSVPYALYAKTSGSSTPGPPAWSQLGNAGTVDGTNFIGTTDNIPFNIRVNNQKAGRIDNTMANSFYGYKSGNSNTTGTSNTANGTFSLFSNTTGSNNTVNGSTALFLNTTGNHNTATGNQALRNNTTGNENTATGSSALNFNTIGSWNTANGFSALYSNTTGYSNVANGYYALYSNTSGLYNTAIGVNALRTNTIGEENTGIGHDVLRFNTTGDENTAIGNQALLNNTTGNSNTATGYQALYNLNSNITGGFRNTANGWGAGSDLTRGSNNIVIGYDAQLPYPTLFNTIRMGNDEIGGAFIQVAWFVSSDKRWKDKIRKLPFGLDVIKQLNPVDYVRKNNDSKTREMGFIAQDVEVLLTKIGYTDQGFLTKDDNGNISLRYNDFIALLTKAMQEQQEMIEELKRQNEAQQKQIDKLIGIK